VTAATASDIDTTGPSLSRRDWSRKYPPLVALLLAMGLAVTVLPSALNLPQSNPSTTLEYAPVPPDDNATPPIGNVNQLGLGSSNGISGGGASGGAGGGEGDEAAPPIPPQTIKGKDPSTKRCVGSPPRQTEDPLSPPCVPYFDCTQNGGATYQGVFENELKILFYLDSGVVDAGTSRGDEGRPVNKYYDLLAAEQPDDPIYVRIVRGWQNYFYDRYQTYCRRVHIFVYYGSDITAGPDSKRADAYDNYVRIKPFAVVSESASSNDAYLEAMARRGVLNFGSLLGRRKAFFDSYPGMIWGYNPPMETKAQQYVEFVCKKVKGGVATLGGPGTNGLPRKYGLIYTTDPNHEDKQQMKDLVVAGLKNCGVTISATGTFPTCCLAEDVTNTDLYASNNMTNFQSQNITTIIWPGGVEGGHSDAAFQRRYFPEWILLGDEQFDGYNVSEFQQQDVWQYAWVVSNSVKIVDFDEEPCFLAYKDADPTRPDRDVRGVACRTYKNLRNLFIGIQVAGPYLGPTSINEGFHQIPGKASTDPQSPACFYNPGDYTCVKDSVYMYWDPNAQAPNNAKIGCWRMVFDAKRFLTGTFPTGDPGKERAPSDPCNGFNGSAFYIGPGL
jgi:hypothetical protein